jgi:hypothetical protein
LTLIKLRWYRNRFLFGPPLSAAASTRWAMYELWTFVGKVRAKC